MLAFAHIGVVIFYLMETSMQQANGSALMAKRQRRQELVGAMGVIIHGLTDEFCIVG